MEQGWTKVVQVFPRSSTISQDAHGTVLRRGIALGLACALSLLAATSFADDQSSKNKRKPKHRNTPLDTIMQTRIWADVPEPKDFVIEHRPDRSKLKYQPVTGTDPERPKLRSPAELKDLETELEAARLTADKKGGIKPSSETASPVRSKPPAAE